MGQCSIEQVAQERLTPKANQHDTRFKKGGLAPTCL